MTRPATVPKGSPDRVCSTCGERKPLTEQHWYFKRTGPYRGQVTGYCRPCQRAFCRAWVKQLTGAKRLWRLAGQRAAMRRLTVGQRIAS